jgi:hypothetical protein
LVVNNGKYDNQLIDIQIVLCFQMQRFNFDLNTKTKTYKKFILILKLLKEYDILGMH